MIKSYELCVLFGGSLTPNEIDEQAKQVESLLQAAGAEIKFRQNLGRRKLAYKINGNNHGEYRSWLFSCEAKEIPGLNAKLRLSNFVVRHLITSLDNKIIEKRIQEASEVKVTKHEVIEEEPLPDTTVETIPATPVTPAAKKEEAARPLKEKAKVSLEDLDKKLDEILESDTI